MESWQIFNEENSQDYELVLVGKDSYFYQKLKEKFANVTNVVFTGLVEDIDLIELYKKAIAICEKNKWLPRIGGIARDMAIAYKNAKKFSEAEEWMLKSLALIKEYYDEGRGMNASLGIGYSKLGLIYTEAKKYPKAERVFTISQKYLKAGNHEYWKLIGAIDYCYYLSARKDYKKAKGILQKVITEGIRQEKEYKLIETFILAGDTEMGLGNKDGAKMFYSMAKLSITKIFDSPEVRGKFQSQIESRIKS